jgi:hypothetical protein
MRHHAQETGLCPDHAESPKGATEYISPGVRNGLEKRSYASTAYATNISASALHPLLTSILNRNRDDHRARRQDHHDDRGGVAGVHEGVSSSCELA